MGGGVVDDNDDDTSFLLRRPREVLLFRLLDLTGGFDWA